MAHTESRAIFADRTVHLDGTRFDQCTFEGCRLVFSGGEGPIFFRCTFNNVRVAVEAHARHTVAFFQLLSATGLGNMAAQILSIGGPIVGEQIIEPASRP
jgi:hypothetical protein